MCDIAVTLVRRCSPHQIRTEVRKHHLPAPQRVRARNSDNTKILRCLGWQLAVSLWYSRARTYTWIYGQEAIRHRLYARL